MSQKTITVAGVKYKVAELEKEGWYLVDNYRKKKKFPVEMRAKAIFIPRAILPKGSILLKTQVREEGAPLAKGFAEIPEEEKGFIFIFTHKNFDQIEEGDPVPLINMKDTNTPSSDSER